MFRFNTLRFMKGSKNHKKELNTDAELKKIGKRLKNLRLAAGYKNMDHFAYEFNFGRGQYADYETAKKDIRVTTLIRLANAHGLSLAELLTFDDE